MIKDITLGQYYPLNSIIHKLDPRTKFIWTFVYIFVLFVVNNFYGVFFLFLFLLGIIFLSKIPISYILKGIKPLLFIILFTVTINLFLTPGVEIFRLWFLKVTYEGVINASFMAIRLILIVSGTSILTLSTSPISLTDGLESLMNKIPFVKKVSHEISMMMSIALRFIPTLMEETTKIINAQKSRGADFESGSIINRAKSFVPILIPLFINAFSRAEELALAMEARCYRGGEGRTKFKELKYAALDLYGYIYILLMIGVAVLCNIYFGAII